MTLYRAAVGYSQTSSADLRPMFGWVHSDYGSIEFKPIDICKDVPRVSCEIEFELVHLDDDMSVNGVLYELTRQGLRPALYEELLGFAKQYPDEQRKHSITAIGSVYGDSSGPRSPRVHYLDHIRSLDFYHLLHCRPLGCRFLTVRK